MGNYENIQFFSNLLTAFNLKPLLTQGDNFSHELK